MLLPSVNNNTAEQSSSINSDTLPNDAHKLSPAHTVQIETSKYPGLY